MFHSLNKSKTIFSRKHKSLGTSVHVCNHLKCFSSICFFFQFSSVLFSALLFFELFVAGVSFKQSIFLYLEIELNLIFETELKYAVGQSHRNSINWCCEVIIDKICEYSLSLNLMSQCSIKHIACTVYSVQCITNRYLKMYFQWKQSEYRKWQRILYAILSIMSIAELMELIILYIFWSEISKYQRHIWIELKCPFINAQH